MGNAAGTINPGTEEAREALRGVLFPGFSRDIVSFGFVRDVDVSGKDITVRFAPNTNDPGKVQTMERGILDALHGTGFQHVDIRTEPRFDDESMLLGGAGTMNPLQAELAADAIEPLPDILREDLQRAASMPAAGEDEQTPTPFDGPHGPENPAYDGPLPVFQWDIDPDDPEAECVETTINLDGWEFHLWWQCHRGSDLVYASLRTMHDDSRRANAVRPHPVGRTEAVNLVYDRKRQGIVAIYGTVRDFRPFVEAFRRTWLAESEESATDSMKEARDE